MIMDISERKKLEAQFFQAQKMESIGTLAGGVAHDFNNLLGGILGYASFMKAKMEEDHPFFKYIDTIEKSATRAAQLTSQLLGLARDGRYDTRPLDLNEIVEETLGILGSTIDKSIEIKTDLLGHLPTVEADSGQLQQALLNLCVNARDAMTDGGELSVVTGIETITEGYAKVHEGAKEGAYVTLSVTDTGMGMDEETLNRIFEPFFTTKEEGKGTGLGLAMVYGVVKNHDGFVYVRSEPGTGSTFKMHLPISGMPETKAPAQRAAPVGGSELILVVDDEEPIRALTRETLESFGYRVLLAEDGRDAISIFKERKDEIALVILDMVMPKMGGRETFVGLKEIRADVKALLSTGYSQSGRAQEILNSGVRGFIQKPYKLNDLLRTVRKSLDSEA
jgi:nitrogen-specific signal transduction histidine kinase/ActR/RegA family two-component response regulator